MTTENAKMSDQRKAKTKTHGPTDTQTSLSGFLLFCSGIQRHFHCMVFGQKPIQGKHFNFIVGDKKPTIVKTTVYSRWHTYGSIDPEDNGLQKHLALDSYDYGQQQRNGYFLGFNDLVYKTCDWHDVLHKGGKMLVDIFLQHPILMVTLPLFLIFNRYIVENRLNRYIVEDRLRDRESKPPRFHKKPRNKTTRDTWTVSLLPSQEPLKAAPGCMLFNRCKGYKNDGLYQHHYVALLDPKQEVAKSVGIVHQVDRAMGTGFLVGKNKVFTSYHLVERMLHLGKNISSIDALKEHIVRDIGLCSISFNYFSASGQKLAKTYNFKSVVHFVNPSMDYIVLEIKSCWKSEKPPNALGTFGEFNTPVLSIYGHPAGGPMIIDQEVRRVSISKQQVKDFHKQFVQAFTVMGFRSQEPIAPPYVGFQRILPTSYFYKSFLGHGSSGGPGVVFDGNGAAVVLMMQGIFPHFYNDESMCTPSILEMVQPDAVFNYGTKMKAVFQDLKCKDPQLCWEIFKTFPKPWDQ